MFYANEVTLRQEHSSYRCVIIKQVRSVIQFQCGNDPIWSTNITITNIVLLSIDYE